MHHFAHGYQVRTLRAASVACISHTAARPSQTEPKFAFFFVDAEKERLHGCTYRVLAAVAAGQLSSVENRICYVAS
jgi:hypothetical protein